MIFYLSICWGNDIGKTNPIATIYAAYIYNRIPSTDYITPYSLFTGSKFSCNNLRDIHMWDCLIYVLDATLQQGHKLTKWKPQSGCGIFVVFSPYYSSDVPIILNPCTGHISPQFHVTFDDYFRTFLYLSIEE